MGLCVAADNEASAAQGRPQADASATGGPGTAPPALALALLEAPRSLGLDGVTGRLTLYGNVVAREPVHAVFRNGVGVTFDHEPPGESKR